MHLNGFAGILQFDGYGAYTALAQRHEQIRLALCWAHVHRKFYELAESSPVVTDVLRRIASLYGIEEEVGGLPAEDRCRVRGQRIRPIVDDLYLFLDARGRQVSAKAKLDEAIRYALKRWDGLTRFLDDERIDLDNNAVERAIRPLALNRKNALFAGSDEGADNWAVIATLIENCKLTGINPHMADRNTHQPCQLSPGIAHRRARADTQRGLKTLLTPLKRIHPVNAMA